MTYDEALEYALGGQAVFITGSGFSVEAYNNCSGDDKTLWIGTQLAKELAKLTDMDENTTLDIVSQQYMDLYGEKKLVEYLKEHYKVDRYEEFYKILAKVKNLRVYSTNYDNCILRPFGGRKCVLERSLCGRKHKVSGTIKFL